MMKNILTAILVFFLGIIFAWIIDPHLRTFIQNLYEVLTNRGIYFVGKNFYLFPSLPQIMIMGLSALVFWMRGKNDSKEKHLINGAKILGLFLFILVALSFVDGNLKVMQCTMCEDGRRGLRYNDISYEGLTMMSILISLIFYKAKLKWKQKELPDILDA